MTVIMQVGLFPQSSTACRKTTLAPNGTGMLFPGLDDFPVVKQGFIHED